MEQQPNQETQETQPGNTPNGQEPQSTNQNEPSNGSAVQKTIEQVEAEYNTRRIAQNEVAYLQGWREARQELDKLIFGKELSDEMATN